jgi:pyridinium-3,5-biscarboxylic acid mononucleotide synthase
MLTDMEIRDLLGRLTRGELTLDAAAELLAEPGGADIGCARIDHQRELRCGFPEVVYGAGKTPAQLLAIAGHFADRGRNLLITRLAPEAVPGLRAALPDGEHDALARTFVRLAVPPPPRPGRITVACAGTSDLAVAGECLNTLRFFGFAPAPLADVGVAGLHRLLACRETLAGADVVIVIAGMEGALPSVVGGLVRVPVIAVPTSMGYGASFGGLAALLAMLNSCAAGVVVTNIDNGFGAACAALRILGRGPA